ncbi:MAG TPA: GntR family transcriptional regulator [Planctomycetota bacterium]|nr:GntR family transcriptional regulator [Planctomycetota bacterium]
MPITKLVPSENAKGSYPWLAEQLKQAIQAGQVRAGANLPSTKEIGSKYGVSAETARRAAKQLEGEGLLVSHPRHGFKVHARANDPDRGLPVAFVLSGAEQPGLWNEFNRLLFAALQKAAAERGWSMLAVGTGERTSEQVIEQLRDCRVSGMILDAPDPGRLASAEKIGMPVVMMDAWEPAMHVDAVVQDSFQGALLAAEHLIAAGHKRIGWLGPISDSATSRERFGGAAAALAAAGLDIDQKLMADTPWEQLPEAARKLLERRDRPTAVLALWHNSVDALVPAAAELKLELGRDVAMVGWSAEEDWNTYRGVLGDSPVPPTITWSIARLARRTIARLAERRSRPGMSPTLIKVPTRLRLPDQREGTEGLRH